LRGTKIAAYVQSAQLAASGTSATLAFGSNTGAGHALVVAGRVVATTPTVSCSDTQGNTYIHAGGIYNSGGAPIFQADVFVTPNSSAAPDTITYTSSLSGTIDIAIHEYSGLVTTYSGILDPTGLASTTDSGSGSTTPSSGSVRPTNAKCVLFGAIAFNAGTATFSAGNMGTGVSATVRQNVSSRLVTEDNIVQTSGLYQTNGTLSAAENWSALLVPLVASYGYLSPIGVEAQFFSNAGAVLASGKIATYLAGTATATSTYTDYTLGSANPNPIILSSAGRLPSGVWQPPGVPIKVVISDSSNNVLVTIDNIAGIGDPATAGAEGIGQTFYPETTAERTIAASIVNYARSPMDVDRYVNNYFPGTTDCTVAWNTAVAVAMVNGGAVTFGATPLYLVTSPINCTNAGIGGRSVNQPGITIQSLGIATHDNNWGILAKHTGMSVFDCTGNDSITFRDVSIKTNSITFPQTGILTARNSTKGSLLIRLYNVKIQGFFGTSCYYNYASEDDVVVGCYFANYCTNPNTKAACWTGSNIELVSSPFVTIASGTITCVDHNAIGCQFLNAGGTGTSDAIYIETSDSVKIIGGWAHSAAATAVPGQTGTCTTSATAGTMTVTGSFSGALAIGMQVFGASIPLGTTILSGSGTTWTVSGSPTWSATSTVAGFSGRSLIYVDMTKGASNFGFIEGLTGEMAQPLTAYGILFSNHSQTPTGWTVVGTKLPNSGNSIAAAGVKPIMDNFRIGGIPTQTGFGMSWPGTIQNSVIDSGFTIKAGSVKNTSLSGDSSIWTINSQTFGFATTKTAVSVTDTGTANRSFAPGIVSGNNGWTVSASGSLTQRGKLAYNSNIADFTIVLQASTTLSSVVGATIQLPFTATDNASATVIDFTTGSSLGAAVIGGSTMTFPVSIPPTTHLLVIEGFCFVS
jgi:hypothetical protein